MNLLFRWVSFIRGGYKSFRQPLECKRLFTLHSSGFNNTFLTFAFVRTQFANPSLNGIICLNEINWLVKYWSGSVFPMRSSFFRRDTIDILSEFWFLGALKAFILSVFGFLLSGVIEIQDDRANWSAILQPKSEKDTLICLSECNVIIC